ncbi:MULTISPECIES: rod shape-determining protein MreD [unclassified Meiothermus]|uniref:rod shape-determining protein MreD n=1 Tax=unclassified Meiothermus TaxID=370471 RepID=UPI000D7C422E|nr:MULTISPECIES: rod shape-determining protein MreD [unclassified Meiothermus]PZA06741.1 rod shape-determining protein MreD [Meiothermus sp. Pnk-1]RYM36666.1 rod shape-determining protein MreD [Meiothermus sp. PNK-Is4]
MRPILLLALTFLLQSLISGLLPDWLSPPDLPFLAVLAIAARVSPYTGLILAFAVGLLMDLSAAGYPGFGPMGYLLGTYVFYRLSRTFHWDEPLGQYAVLIGSLLTKWLGYLLMVYWLRGEPFGFLSIASVFASEGILTLLVAPFFLRLARGSLESPRYE